MNLRLINPFRTSASLSRPPARTLALAIAVASTASLIFIQDTAAQQADLHPNSLSAQEGNVHPEGLFETSQDPNYGQDYATRQTDPYQRGGQRGYAGGYQGDYAGEYQRGYPGQQDELHPGGLFATPQEGLYVQLPWNTKNSETWRDNFHLSLRASVSGETNVFLNNEEEESDIIFYIAPTLSYTTPAFLDEDNVISNFISPRFTVYYTPSYRMYSNNSENNGINHSFNLSFNDSFNESFALNLPKTTISFNLGVNSSAGYSRFSDGLVESTSFYANARLSHRLSGKTSFQLSVTPNFNNFDSSDLIDDTTWNFNASLMYQLSQKISIGPYVGYGISKMSGSAGGIENTQDKRHSYSAGVRMNYQASSKVAFTGSMGWSSYEFDGSDSNGGSSSGEGDSTWTYRMGVSYQPGPKTSLRASIWRDYKPSNNIVNSAYVATGISLTATFRPTDRWSHYATFTFENDDYFSDDPAGGSLDNDYFSLTLGTRYGFNNGLNIGANISSSSQSSSEGANNFDNWIFSLYAQYTFF